MMCFADSDVFGLVAYIADRKRSIFTERLKHPVISTRILLTCDPTHAKIAELGTAHLE